MVTTITDYIELQREIGLAVEQWHHDPNDQRLRQSVIGLIDGYLWKQRRVKELLHMGEEGK